MFGIDSKNTHLITKSRTPLKRVLPIFALLVINSCIKKLDEQRFILQGNCAEIQQFVQDSIIKVPAGVYYGEIEKDSMGCTLVVKYDGSKGDVKEIEKKLIEKKWLVKVDSISAKGAQKGEVVEKVVVHDSIVVVKEPHTSKQVDSTTVLKRDTLRIDTLKNQAPSNTQKDTISNEKVL